MPLSASQPRRSTFVVLFLVIAAAIVIAQSSPSESERDAYAAAVHRKQVQTRIKGLELFLRNFPISILKERALESLADAYEQSGDVQKEQVTLDHLLSVNADNLRGLTLKAELMLLGCDSAGCEQDMTSLADRGFRVFSSNSKPDYLSDAEFGHQKAEAGTAFHRLAGVAAIKQSDYESAQQHYASLVEMNPDDLGFVYPLALTYLNSRSPDMPRALFFLARAAALAPASARQEIEKFGRGQYAKYHGSLDGWQDVLRIAKANPRLPSSFTVASAP